MKKITTFLALFSVSVMFSQWAPTFSNASTDIYRSGRVGIGYTSAPTVEKFGVKGNSLFSGNMEITSGASGVSGLKFTNLTNANGVFGPNDNPVDRVLTVDSTGKIIIGLGGSIFSKSGHLISNRNMALNGFNFQISSNNPFILNTTSPSTSLFFINNNGNVGIGTTTPDTRLAVNGIIHSKEVRVDLTGWPDYVFEENYELPTLEKVEKGIKENGHLQNVPSACEMETNGLMVGQIAKIQQEKIEELTLYLIKQNKAIQELQAQVKILLEKK